ncbi:MAG: DUF669 domain-containing protein [Selenomonadaceae bacterium]|nr:DUF669 domain-containing protein [Selenomonadaceae bacterium]
MGINLRAKGYDNVEERGNFERLPAGGYVCNIIDAEITNSKSGNQMLKVLVDINEGKFAGYFKKQFDSLRKTKPELKWAYDAILYQNLFDRDGNVNGGLKSLLKSVERSNFGFTVNVEDFDEKTLRGKLLGVIFGDKEFEKSNGEVGLSAYARFPRSAEKIREGDFQIPEVVKLDKDDASKQAPIQMYKPLTDDHDDPTVLDDPPF